MSLTGRAVNAAERNSEVGHAKNRNADRHLERLYCTVQPFLADGGWHWQWNGSLHLKKALSIYFPRLHLRFASSCHGHVQLGMCITIAKGQHKKSDTPGDFLLSTPTTVIVIIPPRARAQDGDDALQVIIRMSLSDCLTQKFSGKPHHAGTPPTAWTRKPKQPTDRPQHPPEGPRSHRRH